MSGATTEDDHEEDDERHWYDYENDALELERERIRFILTELCGGQHWRTLATTSNAI